PQPQMETKDVECYVGTLPNRPHYEIAFSHAFRADAPRCSESWIYTARYEIPRSSSAACRPGHLRVRRESGAAAAARCAHDRTADRYPASVERDVGARWTARRVRVGSRGRLESVRRRSAGLGAGDRAARAAGGRPHGGRRVLERRWPRADDAEERRSVA